MINKEGFVIPDMTFPMRINGEWEKLTTKEIFENKKVVVFSLPGAFTPTCSSTHLPRYEELYDVLRENGVDEVYCVSVNDTFVMNEWASAEQITKVKMLPDGNANFTKAMEMLVTKDDLGFGDRSWRYSMVVVNGKVEKQFIEPEVEGDPFEVSDADTMLKYLNPEAKAPESITVFTKPGCKFCAELKTILKEQNKAFSEVTLPDAIRQKVLHGMTGKINNTVPHIYIEGEFIGGLEDYKKLCNIA